MVENSTLDIYMCLLSLMVYKVQQVYRVAAVLDDILNSVVSSRRILGDS